MESMERATPLDRMVDWLDKFCPGTRIPARAVHCRQLVAYACKASFARSRTEESGEIYQLARALQLASFTDTKSEYMEDVSPFRSHRLNCKTSKPIPDQGRVDAMALKMSHDPNRRIFTPESIEPDAWASDLSSPASLHPGTEPSRPHR